jgi:hypothetical protein
MNHNMSQNVVDRKQAKFKLRHHLVNGISQLTKNIWMLTSSYRQNELKSIYQTYSPLVKYAEIFYKFWNV